MIESKQISVQQVKVYLTLRKSRDWMTNTDIAQRLNISRRNISSHTRRLTEVGILEEAKVFGGSRFRLSDLAELKNIAYLARLERAAEVLKEEPVL